MQTQTETTMSQTELPVSNKTHMIADEASFVLHTQAAQAIFLGRWEKEAWGKNRMGLVQFASLMTRMFKAYHHDDPYAHLYIIKAYEGIMDAQEKFKNYELTLQQQIANLRGFNFSLYRNPSPEKLSLRFATVFGYLGAVLVENLDYVNRQLFTFNRRGLTPELGLTTSLLMREVQATFKIPTHWYPTGVMRKDIIENNELAQKAHALLGDIPSQVLNKEIKLRFLQEPRRHEQTNKQSQ